MTLQTLYSLLIIRRDANAENTLALTTAHGQQSMGGATLERLFPVKIVAVFCCLVSISLGFDNFGGDKCLTTEGIAELLARALVFADSLCYNVLCTFKGHIGIFYVTLDETFCSMLWVSLALLEQNHGERFQSLFSGHLSTSATFGLIGEIDIFQFCRIPAVMDALFQFWGHFLEVSDGLDNRLLALLYLLQFLISVADGGNLHFVESSSTLLAIARDEGNCTAFLQKGDGGSYSSLLKIQSAGNQLGEDVLFHM